MGSRRTDLLSEVVDASPRWLRWLLRVSLSILKAARIFIALLAVGGAVAVVVGAVTLNGGLVVGGLVQLVLFGLVYGRLNLGSEQVVEASGAAGSFVIRTRRHRRWKDERGLARVVPLVMGHSTWHASVRQRTDDPFGTPVAMVEAATEREVIAAAQDLGVRIRAGEVPSTMERTSEARRSAPDRD